MHDREIHTSTTCLAAWGLWLLTLTLWASAWYLHLRPVADLAIIVCCAAGVTTIRGYFIKMSERIRSAMIVTGRSAPERDNVRSLN